MGALIITHTNFWQFLILHKYSIMGPKALAYSAYEGYIMVRVLGHLVEACGSGKGMSLRLCRVRWSFFGL